MYRLAPVLLVAVVTSLPAQVTPLTRSCPSAFAGWDAPESNWLPLGRTRTFLQTWYHGSALPKGQLAELGWRIDRESSAPKVRHTIEITLGNTSKTFGNLDRTFANNLGPATLFLKKQDVDFPAIARPKDPNQPSLWIKGDRPFSYTGPHFLVQVDIQTDTAFGYVQAYRVDSFVWEAPIHGTTGRSCGKGQLRAGTAAGQWTLDLAGLKPNDVGIFLIGIDHLTIQGTIRLPLDLSSVGMPGCTLNIDTLLILGSVADGSGTAKLQLPVPKPGADPLVLHAQGLELDPSKPAMMATSNAVHSVLDGGNVANYLFNWGQDGPTAEFGPFATSRAGILLVR